MIFRKKKKEAVEPTYIIPEEFWELYIAEVRRYLVENKGINENIVLDFGYTEENYRRAANLILHYLNEFRDVQDDRDLDRELFGLYYYNKDYADYNYIEKTLLGSHFNMESEMVKGFRFSQGWDAHLMACAASAMHRVYHNLKNAEKTVWDMLKPVITVGPKLKTDYISATERKIREEKICAFIDEMKKSHTAELEKLFLEGYCYYFALILNGRFEDYNGSIIYLPVPGHFVYKTGVDLYDITGCVTGKYRDEPQYNEDEWRAVPSIIKGCILK